MKMRIAFGLAVMIGISCGRTGARIVPGGEVDKGKAEIIAAGCGACHAIDGIATAHGQVGPALAGVANRSVIGGVLPNTPDNMIRWIEDAPSISPNTAMPNLGISSGQARDMAAYLYTRQ